MLNQKKLDRMVDFYKYIDYLFLHQNELLICAVARDTLYNIGERASEKLCELGMMNLASAGWRGYVFVKDNGKVCINKISEKDKSVSEVIEIANVQIKLVSKSVRDGNLARVVINGIECCVGWRGLNIVVFDKNNMRLIDSVCFDFFPGSNMPFKRLRCNLDISFYSFDDVKLVMDDDTASARREKFIKKIKTKAIILLGEKKCTDDFLGKFNSELNIQAICTIDEFSAKRQVDVLGSEQFYYVLCTDNPEKLHTVIEWLRTRGLVYGRDYIRQSQLLVLLTGKKILTVVGFCQLDAVSSILKLTSKITEKYVVNYYNYNVVYTQSFPESVEWVKFSDILIYVPVPFLSAYFKYERIVASDTKMFVYPDTTFGGINPGRKPMQIKTESKLKKMVPKWAPRPFQYVEPVLDELIAEGHSNAEILDMVMKDDFFSEKEILDNFKVCIGVLKKNEAKSDLKISDYILENYQKVLLYRDCLHYTNDLYYEVARRIVDKLGICSKEDIDAVEKSNNTQFMDVSEHPIYPSVAKVLNIKYATPDYKYRVRAGNDTEMMLMTTQEWVENYCDYTRALNTFERLKIMDRFRSL